MTVLFQALASALAATSVAAYTYDNGAAPYSQRALDNFNILKHQGGHGPYSQHTGFGIDRATPEQCTVDQVQLFIRHGERYPTAGLGKSLTTFLQQIKDKKLVAQNELAFMNTYNSPALNPAFYDQESFKGPYGGYQSMFMAGGEFRQNYGHLYVTNTTLPFFTASQERIVVTSVNVARGFFGPKWKQHSHFVVLNETVASGLNSLTVDGCVGFDSNNHADYTVKYGQIALAPALKRFQKNLPGINATTEDIANLISLCYYDLSVSGPSPLCDYFTPNDYKAFEYKRDLDYYYFSGNGNPAVPAVGGVVSNATLTILHDNNNSTNQIYFSFAHETNILMYLATVGLLNPAKDLPFQTADFNNRWTTSQIAPMGMRVALERLSCTNATDPLVTEKYVRFVINDAVVPHDICTSGPGFSCPLDQYVEIQRSRIQDPIAKCKINSTYTAPKELTFYWDWQTTPDKYRNYVVNLDDF